jgi:catecholate siderophore receptor
MNASLRIKQSRYFLKPIYQAMLSAGIVFLVTIPYVNAEDIVLQEVEVKSAKEDSLRKDKGYQAKKSTTATKTDTVLRDVPQAISVVTQEVIQDQSIQSVADAVRYVPGVTAIQGEGNRDALVFRGNATTSDLFVDGIRDDVQTYRDFYNTERIEVLKGPNGMIFGRGGAGGVLNRVTKEAGWDVVNQVTASYGMFDQRRIGIDVGHILSDDIAFRLNAVYENSSSYRDGVNLERYGVNPTFTIKPSEQTKIVLGAEYFKDKRIADRGVPSVSRNDSPKAENPDFDRRPFRIGDRDQFFGNARLSPTETETVAFNALFEHAFDNGVTVKNRTRYADYDKFYQNVFANSPVSLAGTVQLAAYYDETKRENLINQTDVTYTANIGNVEHRLLAGAEFGKQDNTNQRLTPTGSTTANGNFGDPVFARSPFGTPINFNQEVRNSKADVTIAAFYIQDQIILNNQWQAVLGLRHEKFKTDFTNLINGQSFDVSDSFVSPRAGLIYKPVEPLSVYANYSLSYQPRAGEQLNALNVDIANFDPEKFINYEIGAKWDINPDLSVTAAVYKLERQKIAVNDPADVSQLILVDGQETKGVELGVAGSITNNWSVFGGYTYQDGKVTKQQGFGNSAILKGAELAQTPKHTFSLWNRYDINPTWGVALGVISRSDMYAQSPTASQSTILPGYTRLDAAVFAQINAQTRLQVNIENLTNKEYALFAHNNQNITPGAPVNASATLIYDF